MLFPPATSYQLDEAPCYSTRCCQVSRPRVRHQNKRQLLCTSAQVNGYSNGTSDSEGIKWQDVVPSYLHSQREKECDDFEAAIKQAEQRAEGKPVTSCQTAVWERVRTEAQRDAAEEPLLSSFLYASILSHDTFERSLAFVLANRLASVTMLATELFEIFHSILKSEQDVREACVADLVAVKERDPACLTYAAALVYYKGYHAIQAYRIAHALWCRGQKVLALALQSRVSEVFAVDIHPASRLGKGLLLDHGTGVVIGETAVVGNNVSIMQNVTLGGTGKDTGDRHPKIGDNVLISAGATILGNIRVGRGAQIAAGSLVLKPVPMHTMVAGSPAKEVGKVTWNPAQNMEHWLEDVCPESTSAAARKATANRTTVKPTNATTTSPTSNAAAGPSSKQANSQNSLTSGSKGNAGVQKSASSVQQDAGNQQRVPIVARSGSTSGKQQDTNQIPSTASDESTPEYII